MISGNGSIDIVVQGIRSLPVTSRNLRIPPESQAGSLALSITDTIRLISSYLYYLIPRLLAHRHRLGGDTGFIATRNIFGKGRRRLRPKRLFKASPQFFDHHFFTIPPTSRLTTSYQIPPNHVRIFPCLFAGFHCIRGIHSKITTNPSHRPTFTLSTKKQFLRTQQTSTKSWLILSI